MIVSIEYYTGEVLYICQPSRTSKTTSGRRVENYLSQGKFDAIINYHTYTVVLPKEMT